MANNCLVGKSGKKWEIQMRLGEAIMAMEVLMDALTDERKLELLARLQTETNGLMALNILRKILKGKIGLFLTAFVVPEGAPASDDRDLEAEWAEIRNELGAGALFKVLRAFFESQSFADVLREAQTAK